MKQQMNFKRFNDIDCEYIKSDLHIHSTWTDGHDSIVDIVKQSEILKLKTIAITDHIRLDSFYFHDYANEIEKIKKTTNINILIGFESRIKNFRGELDVCENIKNIADLKIASVHRFPFGNKLFKPNLFTKEIAQEIELELSLTGIKNGGFDVLGHSGGMCLKYFKEFPLKYFEDIIIACNHNNIAFELNSEYHFKIYPQLKCILKKHNPLVTFGSDSHNINNIGKWFSLYKNREFENEKN